MTAFTIVGAGAIGGILGAALHEAGHDVTFVEADPAHRAAIAADGLRVSGWRERLARVPVLAPDALGAGLGCVLLAVKSGATDTAIGHLRGRLADDGTLVSLQNGHNAWALAEAFGAGRVIGACLTFGGFVEGPGRVRHAGEGSFHIGRLDGSIDDTVRALAAAFAALQPCEPTANVAGHLWAKMVLGAVYYGTAVLDRDVPEIYADARARVVLGQAAAEAALVARGNGVTLEDCDGFVPWAFADGDVAGIAASWAAQRAYWASHVGNARTGIWRDLAIHRRRTEGRAHLGGVIARRGAIATPVLDRLLACVVAIEEGTGRLGWHNLEALAG